MQVPVAGRAGGLRLATGQLLVQFIFCLYMQYMYISSTIRLHSWSARYKEQDRAISATHIRVSAVGNCVGVCKVMSSASVWPDVYVHRAYVYGHIYQEHRLCLGFGDTCKNRVKATLHLLGYGLGKLF